MGRHTVLASIGIPGAVLLLLAGVGAAQAKRPRTSASEESGLRQEVSDVLARADASRSERTVANLAARLASHGAVVAPVLLDVAGDQGVDRDARRDLLGATFASLGREALAPLLDARAGLEQSDGERLATLIGLEAVGSGADLPLALRVVQGPEAALLGDDRVVQAFTRATEAMLRRDPDSLAGLAPVLRDAHPAVAAGLVRAAAACRHPGALDLFARVLGHAPEIDIVLLSHIGGLPGAAAADEFVRAAVRKYLSHGDRQFVRAAVMALGEFEDFEAVPQLARLLGGEDAALGACAQWSLRRITGLDLPAEGDAWAAWFEGETRWYEERAGPLHRMLEETDSGPVFSALQELATHRIHRTRSAERIAHLLERDEVAIRRAACAALGQLGAQVALAELVACLDDERVAETAWTALRRITRKELPAERAVWADALDLAPETIAPRGG